MSSGIIRFSFRITSGPDAGLSVGQFRIWCHGDDTYVADVGVPAWKTSLHGEVAWQTAETRESFTSPSPRLSGGERAPWKFTPPDFVNGRRLAFVIGVTRGSLGNEHAPERYETVEVRDRWDELTKVNLWMGQPGVSTPSASERIGPVLGLSSGNRVWAAVGREPIAAVVPEPLPVTAAIEPQIPGIHDVTAPGLLLWGVHVAKGGDPTKPSSSEPTPRRARPDAILRGAVDLTPWLSRSSDLT